jgi:hydroxymethylbilane synthase
MGKTMNKNRISIGTRGSKLALWQAEWVKSELERLYPDLHIDLKKIKTTGDKILDVPLAKVGGKGLFVKEIEEALLKNEVDIAVHSMKDVPTEFPDGLHLAVICKREDPRDAFISKIRRFRDLPHGAKVGTSSLRRSCQLLHIRPDLKIQHLRGNLDTRIRKLAEGQFEAIIVAAAGIKRLGFHNRITEILPLAISVPAVGQGALGIECRIDDEFIHRIIDPLNHPETSICVKAERAFLKRLEGGCQVPIAAYARIERKEYKSKFSPQRVVRGDEIRNLKLVMDGLVGSISGDRIIKGNLKGNPENAESLGITLADDILSRGAKEILEEVYGEGSTIGQAENK